MTWTAVSINGTPVAAFPTSGQAVEWTQTVLDIYKQLPRDLWPAVRHQDADVNLSQGE